MQGMFQYCQSFTKVTLGFDTASCRNMGGMLSECINMTELDISSFDTRKVEDFWRYDGSGAKIANFLEKDLKLGKIKVGEHFTLQGRGNAEGQFPVPEGASIPGATGNWYAESDGAEYAYDAIPALKADTYLAVPQQVYATLLTDGILAFTRREAGADLVAQHGGIAVESGSQATKPSEPCVYTGFEKLNHSTSTDVEFRYARNHATKVVFVDEVTPVSTYSWFYSFKVCTSMDLDKLNMSKAEKADSMFGNMALLQEVTLGESFRFVSTKGYLPSPSASDIPGADGKWYDASRTGYAPADIPSGVAATYSAIAPSHELTGKVTIQGTPSVGNTLKASVTDAPSDATLSYVWYVGDVEAGYSQEFSISASYFQGQTVHVVVTDASGKYEGSLTSASIGPIRMVEGDAPGEEDAADPVEPIAPVSPVVLEEVPVPSEEEGETTAPDSEGESEGAPEEKEQAESAQTEQPKESPVES